MKLSMRKYFDGKGRIKHKANHWYYRYNNEPMWDQLHILFRNAEGRNADEVFNKVRKILKGSSHTFNDVINLFVNIHNFPYRSFRTKLSIVNGLLISPPKPNYYTYKRYRDRNYYKAIQALRKKGRNEKAYQKAYWDFHMSMLNEDKLRRHIVKLERKLNGLKKKIKSDNRYVKSLSRTDPFYIFTVNRIKEKELLFKQLEKELNQFYEEGKTPESYLKIFYTKECHHVAPYEQY